MNKAKQLKEAMNMAGVPDPEDVPKDFLFRVDLDERGEFKAAVEDPETEEDVFSIDTETLSELIEDGFMRSKEDLKGLQDHLTSLGILPKESVIVPA